MFVNGNRVKMLRKERKLTQQVLADQVGISKAALSQIENNKINASRDTVSALSRVLEVTSDYILGLSEHRELDKEASSEVQIELNKMKTKIETLSEERQKMLLDMMNAIIDTNIKSSK
ncbi:helix-turn-helix domain-containing protein [Bacillus cereus]|nr:MULTISPECIES: helix-turn-helix transcriptional regulator [Bacillus cereus group]MBE7107030.1 helix-turn-helix domain-containing protein [Bacillus cereus]QWG92784.1 XRE family transcriptional regulator [Bacillus mycoides]